MKKSLRAGMALTSLVFAAGLIFSGCLAISDEESEEAETTSEISAGSINRAAVSYSGTSGILGSITSATPTGSGLTGVKAPRLAQQRLHSMDWLFFKLHGHM